MGTVFQGFQFFPEFFGSLTPIFCRGRHLCDDASSARLLQSAHSRTLTRCAARRAVYLLLQMLKAWDVVFASLTRGSCMAVVWETCSPCAMPDE
jgi:hypothetical protein